mmetsp:Transcript_125840/g.242599  ORF Transcript_125840/g.242599 Transcript_125840/m.242599 type:complete len:571 (+) Transcript_125840:136-1848(+)
MQGRAVNPITPLGQTGLAAALGKTLTAAGVRGSVVGSRRSSNVAKGPRRLSFLDAGDSSVKENDEGAADSKRRQPRSRTWNSARKAEDLKEAYRDLDADELVSQPLPETPLYQRKADHQANVAKSVEEDVLLNCGATGHSPRRFNVQAEKNNWKLTADDLRSSAAAASAATEYAARKIAAAAEFIKSLPHFEKEDLFLSQNERETLQDPGKLAHELQAKYLHGTRNVLRRQPEMQRLDHTLTEDVIRDICNAMYDLVGGGGGSGYSRGESLIVGSIEAALMAWDLTSEIQGAWRIPLTIVSKKGGVQYSYVCVLIHVGARLAALGRSMLEELTYQPLVRQRASDVVDKFMHILMARGHDPTAVYLGLPTECPNPSEAAKRPVIWRYLKLSCERQEWASLLATCDLFIAQRRAIRRQLVFNLGGSALPRGFKSLDGGLSPRLKAGPPALTRKRRPRRRRAPPMGCMDPRGLVSPSGVWLASRDELRVAMYGSPELPDQHDMEDWSSVSSASMDEYEEDKALHLAETREGVSMHSTRLSLITTEKPSPTKVKGKDSTLPRFASIHAFNSLVH